MAKPLNWENEALCQHGKTLNWQNEALCQHGKTTKLAK